MGFGVAPAERVDLGYFAMAPRERHASRHLARLDERLHGRAGTRETCFAKSCLGHPVIPLLSRISGERHLSTPEMGLQGKIYRGL